MYFNYLVNKLGIQEENISLPANRVTNVRELLKILALRKLERGYLLAEDNVRVTVNRQFAEPFTRLEDGDEIGIVPNSPNPPAPPKK
ncbi:MoaD/ThiS family protein [Thiolapillus sp.]